MLSPLLGFEGVHMVVLDLLLVLPAWLQLSYGWYQWVTS